jgi:flagellar hook-length control protein FliK
MARIELVAVPCRRAVGSRLSIIFFRSVHRMTAATVGSTSVTTAAPRGSSVGTAPGSAASSAGSDHFDHQLHVARQRNASRDPDRSSTQPHASAPDMKPHQASKPGADASQVKDAHDVPAAPANAPAAAPPIASTTPPASPAQEANLPVAKAPADTSEGDDRAASALAGAMLALIAPSVAGVLRPAAAAGKSADVLVQSGNGPATNAAAATLLQLDPAAGAATPITANPMPVAIAGMLGAADGLLPIAPAGKDSSPDGAAPALALSAPPPTVAPALPPVLQLQSPVGSQAFAQDLGQQVAWLGGQNIKQARIRLHPEELGSLDVKLSVTHGRVDVVFSAQHPGAVLAVQQSLPQLDHMLAQHGLSLGHAEVGQQHRGDRHGSAADTGSDALDDVGEIHGVAMSATSGTVSLLDAFA